MAIRERTLLHRCYMPFVHGGGLFLPTDADYALGEEVSVTLDLMHEAEPIRAAGKIVWVTPKGAQGNRVAGVGIGFDGNGGDVRRRIEACLCEAFDPELPTHTL